MADTLKFTLDEENEKRLFELLTDVDVSKTPSFSIKDKHGNEAEYFKGVRCKDCNHWDGYYCHHKWYGDGYANYPPPIKSEEGFCDWAERKERGKKDERED